MLAANAHIDYRRWRYLARCDIQQQKLKL